MTPIVADTCKEMDSLSGASTKRRLGMSLLFYVLLLSPSLATPEAGMTADQVRVEMGEPSGVMSSGKGELWLYDGLKVTFKNGVVTAVAGFTKTTYTTPPPEPTPAPVNTPPPVPGVASMPPAVSEGDAVAMLGPTESASPPGADKGATFSSGATYYLWRNDNSPVTMEDRAGSETSLSARRFGVVVNCERNPSIGMTDVPLRIRLTMPGSGVGTAYEVWELASEQKLALLSVPFSPGTSQRRFLCNHPVEGAYTQTWKLVTCAYPSAMVPSNEVILYAVADGFLTNPISNVITVSLQAEKKP